MGLESIMTTAFLLSLWTKDYLLTWGKLSCWLAGRFVAFLFLGVCVIILLSLWEEGSQSGL